MADRLDIYKTTLRYLGNAAGIASLTENSPSRRALDDAWNSSVEYMISKGLWNFAIRTVELTHDEDVEPLFGYQFGFSKPDDWVRTADISNDPTFGRDGFEEYEDEAGYWYADIDPLYVRYVSNDPAYGWNIGAWRESFAKALAAHLAFECGLPISSDRGTRNDVFSLHKALLKEAKALDAVDERVQKKPTGILVKVRCSGGAGRYR